MTADTTPQDLAQEIKDYLAEGWSGPRDARLLARAAVLLRRSPVVRPKEEEGSLRPLPSAPGPQWAVLRQDSDDIYTTEASARRVLLFLGEDGEEDYRLYEIREVDRG